MVLRYGPSATRGSLKMRKTLYIILISILMTVKDAVHHCSGGDPCLIAKQMYEPYARAQVCTFEPEHSPCDRYLNPGWYKFEKPFLDQCPQLLSCGAVYPVWLNGSLPSVGDGIVFRNTCRVGFDNCCSKHYTVQIKFCGMFYTYCFPSLDACPERFCFGVNGSCEYPHTTTTMITSSEKMAEKEYEKLESRYIAVIAVLSSGLFLTFAIILALYVARKKKHLQMISQRPSHLVRNVST